MLIAAVFAGCADDVSREREYSEGVFAAKESVDQAYTAASSEGATDVEVDALIKATQDASVDVKDLEPPSDLADEDKDLQRSFELMRDGALQLRIARREAAAAAEGASNGKAATAALTGYLQGELLYDETIRGLQADE
jgi:hypothetical protein